MIIHCDGLCEPNPGKATWAFIVISDEVEHQQSGYIGDDSTNNVAEYMAVLKALEYALAISDRCSDSFEIFTDSQLVVKQVSGEWDCKKDSLIPLRNMAQRLLHEIDGATLQWVPGRDNQADKLTRLEYQKATGVYPEHRVWPKKHARRFTRGAAGRL